MRTVKVVAILVALLVVIPWLLSPGYDLMTLGVSLAAIGLLVLLFWLRGSLSVPSSGEMRKSPRDSTTDIVYAPIASIHEAGHALLYACLDMPPFDLRVSIRQNDVSHGMTTGIFIREAVDSEWLHWEMLLSLAGREAERTIFEVTTPGCVTDLKRWQELGRTYLSSGMGGLYFVEPKSDWERQRNEKALADLLTEHENLLQRFFQVNRVHLRRLAGHLEEKEVMGREELVEYLGAVEGLDFMPSPRIAITLGG